MSQQILGPFSWKKFVTINLVLQYAQEKFMNLCSIIHGTSSMPQIENLNIWNHIIQINFKKNKPTRCLINVSADLSVQKISSWWNGYTWPKSKVHFKVCIIKQKTVGRHSEAQGKGITTVQCIIWPYWAFYHCLPNCRKIPEQNNLSSPPKCQ